MQELVIVHGRPRHPQSQGSVERTNTEIKEMIISWMNDNDTIQ
jgi:transposase InsO family protein